MILLSPSIARLEQPLHRCIQLINALGCESVHVDACHGFTLPNFLTMEDISSGSLRDFVPSVTLHLFSIFGGKVDLNFLRKQDLVVLHVFPHMTTKMVDDFLMEVETVGCRSALALDLKGDVEFIRTYIQRIDTIFVMGIPVATYGLQPDCSTSSRLTEVSAMIMENNSNCRIGLDGGVNIDTFLDFASRVDELVIGSMLFNVPDVFAQWRSLKDYSNRGGVS